MTTQGMDARDKRGHDGPSGDFAVSVEESGKARPQHPKDESGGKHIYAVQPGRSCSPCDGIEYSENDNDAGPVSGERAHVATPRFVYRPRRSIINVVQAS
jgi:hypothetical protein